MAGDLVLITGATGFVGFAILRDALKAGYRIRAVVRSESKGKKLAEYPVINNLTKDGGNFEYVVVPDFTIPGALDEAAKGAKYVLHVASPLPNDGKGLAPEQIEERIVSAAVKMTKAVLESANKAGTVERVVLTSSCAAILPFSVLIDYASYDGHVFTADSHPPELSGPFEDTGVAYFASKTGARNYAEEYVRKNKPGFDVIQILPSVVIGRGDNLETTEDWKASTNGQSFPAVMGETVPMPFPHAQVHLDDVAALHVQALDKKIPGNQSYVASSDGGVGRPWDDAKEIVKEYFPKAVESGLLPNNGSLPGLRTPVEIKKTEEAFGIEFQSFEKQTRDAIAQYLELAGHAAE